METLTDLNKDTVEGLKKLIRMNHDASEGFSDAADRVDRGGCRNVFRNAADERSRFASELKTALALGDEDIPEGGTALGLFHRCWLNVRSAISGGDEEVILSEVARGESALVDAYEEILVDTAGSPLNPTLHRHIASVRAMRDGVEALKADLK